MKNYDASKFDRPSVTVDILVFTIDRDELKIVLIKRGVAPFKDTWALPGGFVKMDESLEEAAARELHEETGIKKEMYLEQLYTFGRPDRDPRTRVITAAYMALTPEATLTLDAATDAADARLFSIKKLPPLAFDHKEILRVGIDRLKSKIRYTNIAYGLLPTYFRLSQLQDVYEIILGKKMDKRNFRKQMLASGLLETTQKEDRSGAHRPALLYRFKKKEITFVD